MLLSQDAAAAARAAFEQLAQKEQTELENAQLQRAGYGWTYVPAPAVLTASPQLLPDLVGTAPRFPWGLAVAGVAVAWLLTRPYKGGARNW